MANDEDLKRSNAAEKPERAKGDGLAGVIQNSVGLLGKLEQLVAAGKLVLVAAVFIFFTINWGFFSEWLRTVQHAEGFGLKFDRERTDQNIKALFSSTNKTPREGDPKSVFGVVKQAALLGQAIQGGKILWVDPVPNNNVNERRILEDMGISVQLAWSTTEALRFLAVNGTETDLVISNIFRNEPSTTPLSSCVGVYYDFIGDSKFREKFSGDLWKLNSFEQTSPPAGFAMAELLAKEYPGLFGDHQRPRIIFYTADSGGKAADACARVITNRPDVLLENVVSALAAFRSARLPDPSARLKDAAPPKGTE